MQRVVKVAAVEFASAHEAIQHSEAAGGVAVLLNARPCVVSRADADRLAAAGASFAYLLDHRGRIMTVPVN